MLVTVDGQSSTGKSSLAGSLASRLGFHFLGSGSLYRLVAYAQLKSLMPIEDFVESLENHLVFEYDSGDMRVIYNGEDLTNQINEAEVTKLASDIAKDVTIRNQLGPIQHYFNRAPGLVAEGRDMGTIIFPKAQIKFFLVADVAIRAQRRHRQLIEMGLNKPLDELIDLLSQRDLQDENREISPLIPAVDAVMIDASLTWAENLEEMYQHVVSQIHRSDISSELVAKFEEIKHQAQLIYSQEKAGDEVSLLDWWREQKPLIEAQFGVEPIEGCRWLCPVYERGFKYRLDSQSPKMNDYRDLGQGDEQVREIDMHFKNQLMRIPKMHKPTPKKLMQIALNIGGGLANQTVNQDYQIHDFISIQGTSS